MAIGGFVGGFVGSLATSVAADGWGSLAKGETWLLAGISGAIGAVVGVALGGGAALAGSVIRSTAGKVVTQLITGGVKNAASKMAASAATRGVASAVVTTARTTAAAARTTVTAARNATNAVTKRVGGCRTAAVAGEIALGTAVAVAMHSFDPSTEVLMADGTTRRLSEVKVGDEVVATDPETGHTSAQPVTALHHNLDTDLVDVTVAPASDDDADAASATLHTTSHHPFWDASTGQWVNAADLTPGESTVVGTDGQRQTVVAVAPVAGPKYMRDLTVAVVHTYYVFAGDSPVLVHNCDYRKPPFKNDSAGKQYDEEIELARNLGVSPLGIGQAGFDAVIAAGRVKWAMDQYGYIKVVPAKVGKQEIAHSVIFEGADVWAAGEAEIVGGVGEYVGLWISRHSGHYHPCECSLGKAELAFQRAGITFEETRSW
jgi:hypothetical protein